MHMHRGRLIVVMLMGAMAHAALAEDGPTRVGTLGDLAESQVIYARIRDAL